MNERQLHTYKPRNAAPHKFLAVEASVSVGKSTAVVEESEENISVNNRALSRFDRLI